MIWFFVIAAGIVIGLVSTLLGATIDTWQFWLVTTPLAFLAGMGLGALQDIWS